MKTLLIFSLSALSAIGAPIKQNFATTNTPTVLTNIISSMAVASGVSLAQLQASTNSTTLHSQGLALSTELVAATNTATLASQGLAKSTELIAATNSTTLASQGMATKVYADTSSLNATNPSTGAGNIVRASAPTIDGATLTGTLTIPGTVNITNPVFINGIISTNIFSPTNSALGGAIVDFLYTETTTNAAGTIAYTGFSGFSPTNYNWKIIHILANGADRTVTFPTNTRLPVPPACVVTNGTQKDVLIQLQQGVFTNATWYSTL